MKDTSTLWTVDIDGSSVPLRITMPAIIGIEADTGRTLFQWAEAAVARAVPLRALATILRYLAGPDCSVEALRGPETVDGFVMPMLPQLQGERAEEVIVRNGMITVMTRVMLPIMAALKSGTLPDGSRRPGYEGE